MLGVVVELAVLDRPDVPSSFENGWWPPSTSTMLSGGRRCAAPGETWVPRSFGPRCAIASVIRVEHAVGDERAAARPRPG